MIEIAFAFSRRYRWHNRLVPRIEIPGMDMNHRRSEVLYTVDEAVQRKIGLVASARRLPMT
jgi:hypothetical protein